jgi:predicted MPP superfamily phosphohydrolase
MKNLKTIAFLMLVGFLSNIGLYGFLLEPTQIEVKELLIKDSNLARSLRGLTLIQISDLHIRRIGASENRVLKMNSGSDIDY